VGDRRWAAVATPTRACEHLAMVDSHLLTEQEAEAAVANLPGWTQEGPVLVGAFEMESFPLGIELVRRAANSAEAANHHPDIDVRWRTVTFRLTTHESGGLTPRDVNLAKRIQGHATALGWIVP
jgi:4a-hydroxytetrahydrobiopterin dehydratase